MFSQLLHMRIATVHVRADHTQGRQRLGTERSAQAGASDCRMAASKWAGSCAPETATFWLKMK